MCLSYFRDQKQQFNYFHIQNYGYGSTIKEIHSALSPFSMEHVLERFRRRLCTRLILAGALPGEDKARTKSAPKPLQNTLHGKRA